MTQTLLLDLTAYIHNKLQVEEEFDPLFDATFAAIKSSQVEINEIITSKVSYFGNQN
jgi:hypothetical protein